jgi:hypothetical protein
MQVRRTGVMRRCPQQLAFLTSSHPHLQGKNAWSCTSIRPRILLVWCLNTIKKYGK